MKISPNNNFDFDYLPDELISIFLLKGELVDISAGKRIIRKGQLCDFFFIVQHGCFRTYRTVNGKEFISGFSFKGDLDTVPYSFFCNQKSQDDIQAIVDCQVIKIDKRMLKNLSAINKSIDSFVLYLLAEHAENMHDRLMCLKAYTAEKNYTNLRYKYPDQIDLIPLKYIASFLGISQERLSRIRKSI
jgi:CRP/FNR family transcriptional regulator, anaerobic regulatory protein